ncbi:MAG: UDP-glucose/GDP-mannose dehydrogenase family protein [Actinobacteria bacterium]|nr:UDP-glucose/GDP-mannose dehydrogenase family protein [Actinomycetota bacterium]
MKVGVVGTGHVGLVTCASLAAVGHDVVGNDLDEEKVAQLRRGDPWFYEPGLKELLGETMQAGKLRFTSDPGEAMSGAEVVFICVGTPPRASGEANLIAVEHAARNVAKHADRDVVVVEKSTVPAGTAQRVKRTLERERSGAMGHAEVVSNPEFLREGSAIEDSLNPDRILIGAESRAAFDKMRELYAPLIEKGAPVIETDIPTAELAKHACNAFLALKISYVNALARLCEKSGGDVVAVADVMGSDDRIGRSFLNAGLGYGGYCFPKDVQAFESLAARLGSDFPLLGEIARINDQSVDAACEKVVEALWNVEGKKVALLGLAFKPGTDDVRNAPALALARKLLLEGARVVGYDPEGSANAKADCPQLEIAPDAYDAATDAHCVVICTEWAEIKELDLGKLTSAMAYPVIVDGRNLFDPEEMKKAGVSYYPTGRPHISS